MEYLFGRNANKAMDDDWSFIIIVQKIRICFLSISKQRMAIAQFRFITCKSEIKINAECTQQRS